MKLNLNTLASKLIFSSIAVLLLFFIALAFYSYNSISIGVSSIQKLNMERMSESIKESIELSYKSKKTLIETYSRGAGMGSDIFYINYGN